MPSDSCIYIIHALRKFKHRDREATSLHVAYTQTYKLNVYNFNIKVKIDFCFHR